MRAAADMPGPGDQRYDVRGQWRGRGELPPPGAWSGGQHAVGGDGPVLGGGYREGDRGPEVGLVERGEDALGLVGERHGVQVDFPVDRVDDSVHPRPVLVYAMSASAVSVFRSVRPASGSRLSTSVAGSRSVLFNRTERTFSGLHSTNVREPGVARNRMVTCERNRSPPPVTSRSN